MYKAVCFNGKTINVTVQEYLKRHRIVFKSPQYKGYNGMPVGNGSFGGLVYHSKTKTHFTLSHTDAIDFGPDGNFEAWSKASEEVNTAPVSCGHLTITDHMPSFDTLYLNDYEGSLDISNGMIDIHTQTAFSNTQMKVFVSEKYQMEVIQYETAAKEPTVRSLELSRWGSRNFFHDYEQVSTDKAKNLGGMTCGEENGCVYVSQRVRGCETAVLMLTELLGPRKGPDIKKLNNHTMQVLFEGAEELKIRIYLRVIAGESINLKEEIHKFQESVAACPFEILVQNQNEAWKSYWQESFVHLGEDDYLENMYYTYSYMMNSCSKGKYPVTFGAIWCHNHDTRNWGHYYHWNHQQIYWGLLAAGKEKLCRNYLEYRYGMLKNAIEDGRRLFQIEGAYFSDISNYNGYQALEPDTVRNLTCGAQIALDFYRFYKYTDDETFLKTRAYPFMLSVMKLYEGILVKNQEGIYEVQGGSTCYESYWNLKHTVTDQVMVTALSRALLETGRILGEAEERLKKWADLAEHIYPIHTVKTEYDGAEIDVISAGLKWNHTEVAYMETEYPLNTFGLCQMSGVFPAEAVTMSSECEVLKLYRQTARVIFQDYVYEKKVKTAGHNMSPILAARLGMKEDTIKILHTFLEEYQYFQNGLCHFVNIKKGVMYPENYRSNRVSYGEITDWEKVHEKTEGDRILIPRDDFIHPYFEAQGEIFMAVNEMLLQSIGGVIRVFGGVPKHYSGVFCLKAEGNHEVMSEMKYGEIRYIALKAGRSGEITVIAPWDGEVRVLCERKETAFNRQGEKITINIQKGNEYVLEPCEAPLGQYYQNHLVSEENRYVKYFSGNQIGCERNY